ncbi:MAG: efflux RND transporter permease subunit [Desulfobacterales bacterium]|nr:efflux RND transporter permease subunit [Desulfobacterales bacterium]
MIISDTAVKNRLSVLVLCVIICVWGMYSYLTLPRESFPDITIPHVFVSTTYKGVASKDMETSITIPIEKKLKGLEKLKKIKSVSSEGTSQIDVEFIAGTDIDDVLRKVKDKVDEAKRDLPVDLEDEPAVFEVNFSEIPIVVYCLSGTCGNKCLKELADDLKDDIEGINGVLEVEITGGRDREIRIEVDPDKLAYYRIPITLLQQVVNQENQNTSGGSIKLGDGRYQLRVPGEFSNPDEIYGLVVSSYEGRPVYLKDVASIVDGLKDETGRSRLDGVESINISVKKRTGENILSICEEVDAVVAKRSLIWPQDTRIAKVMDQARDVRNMVTDLDNNIISGLILVVAVLFFVMGFRNAVLVSLAIPLSMLLAFVILQALGITLNMVVLFSLTLALGMLVDNAIVIIENIYRFMEHGVGVVEAAMKATSEVAYPVIGSTLTTVAAFLPMLFWPGIMGEFMKYLPITLIVTLLSSLTVALVMNSALCAFFMKVKRVTSPTGEHQLDPSLLVTEQPVNITKGFLKYYALFLKSCLRHRLVVLCIALAVVIVLIELWLLIIGLQKPVEFFPKGDPKNAYINVSPPEAANLDYIDQVMKTIEMKVVAGSETSYAVNLQEHRKASGDVFSGPSDLNNIEHIYSRAIENPGVKGFEENEPNHIGIQFLDYADRPYPSSRDLEEIRKRIKDIPGAKITVNEQEEGPPTGSAINIEVSGDDFFVLGNFAKQIAKVIQKIPFVEDVRHNYEEGIPSIRIQIDRQKAALFGLSTGTIGFALKIAYNGLAVSTYREGDDDYDITVKFSESNLKETDVLHQLLLPTPSGQMVPLTTIAKIENSGTIGSISRVNHRRVVTVKANVDENKKPAAVARLEAEELLKKITIPDGYRIDFTGEKEEQQESQDFLMRAFMIAVGFIFLILVVQFNSIIQPVIIMTSVILSLGGAFLGLSVIQAPFGIIMTGIGVISLAGVVVNNAIVLIDYTNRLRDTGMLVIDACVYAGATRLRPVLLTAITTVLGLIPMVTGVSYDFHKMAWSFASEATEFWRTMAIVVIFGLCMATFLTLVVVPCMYSLIESSKTHGNRIYTRIKVLYWKPMERFNFNHGRHGIHGKN